MNPSRKYCPTSDQINLQQSMSKSMENTPSHIGNNVNPPPVPTRQAGSVYQTAFPNTGFGYGMNPYQNIGYGINGGGYGGYIGRYTNPVMQGSTMPSDSIFNGIGNVGLTAFQSAGSVVQTISSVSMMLESTLFAMQNSIQAMASVAEQLSRLRNHLAEMSISVIQIIKYYFRKLYYLFKADRRAGVDKIWDEATHQSTNSHNHSGIILFFAVIIGTPWLMWNLIKSIISEHDSSKNWHKGIGEHFIAEVKFTYEAVNKDELSVTCGDKIYIAPKNKQPQIRGWVLASKGEIQGIVPATYIKIISKSSSNTEGNQMKLQELDEKDKKEKLTEITNSHGSQVNETVT